MSTIIYPNILNHTPSYFTISTESKTAGSQARKRKITTNPKGFENPDKIEKNKIFLPGNKRIHINPKNAETPIALGLEATRGIQIPIKMDPRAENRFWYRSVIIFLSILNNFFPKQSYLC